MKTKARKSKPEIQEPVKPSEPEQAPSTDTVEASRGKERVSISFDVNADGSPDFSSMRDKTRERVKQFFNDPKIAAEFGAKPPATPQVIIFNPLMISGMYDMIGAIEMMLAIRMGKIPEPIARKVFPYTPQEKEALMEPTVKVMNKYLPDWMIKYADEIALLTTLGSITMTKINTAILYTKMAQQAASTPPAKSQEKPAENGEIKPEGTTAQPS